ncbi:MAG: hypothetical protein OXH52_22500 [Gammaproteobacteria bacterium]|nr:hypothetical protein [Gammaproteobacteria bacterium]
MKKDSNSSRGRFEKADLLGDVVRDEADVFSYAKDDLSSVAPFRDYVRKLAADMAPDFVEGVTYCVRDGAITTCYPHKSP